MDPIKEAFARAKQDIDALRVQMTTLQAQLEEIKSLIKSQNQPTSPPSKPTDTVPIPTHKLTELPNLVPQVVKSSNMSISIGNEGVPTHHPTNQPTNQHSGNEGVPINPNFVPTHNERATHSKTDINRLAHVAEILASLDGLKKEVRIKFKRLTEQEMVVFTKLYEFDDAGAEITYELLAQALQLTSISIRDYIGKIIKKGIPLEKTKENNKRVLLRIPDELKQIASLQTIHQLRSL